MDAYLDRMARPHLCIRWDMHTWWFTQQVPGYWLYWNQIDRPIWLALLDCSPQLFLHSNMPIQRFMWYCWDTVPSDTFFDENL
jgi:hypothetical protein